MRWVITLPWWLALLFLPVALVVWGIAAVLRAILWLFDRG